jgi:hypothetical protein
MAHPKIHEVFLGAPSSSFFSTPDHQFWCPSKPLSCLSMIWSPFGIYQCSQQLQGLSAQSYLFHFLINFFNFFCFQDSHAFILYFLWCHCFSTEE